MREIDTMAAGGPNHEEAHSQAVRCCGTTARVDPRRVLQRRRLSESERQRAGGDAVFSTPAESPTAESKPNFNNALEFTRMVHLGKYGAAAGLVAPQSPAARYVAHQQAADKAQEINGDDATVNPDDYAFDPDPKDGTIKIDTGDGETVYTWKEFAYDANGKIVSWTGASGPVAKVLWSKESKASALGASARLVSAYRSNTGDMWVVVEWSAKRKVMINGSPSYSANGGYKQSPQSWSSQNELAAGEKTLAYYSFAGAKFGGKLRLDVDTPSYSDSDTLILNVT